MDNLSKEELKVLLRKANDLLISAEWWLIPSNMRLSNEIREYLDKYLSEVTNDNKPLV